MIDTRKIKKLLILNIPYIIVGLIATNIGEAWRMAEGADSSAKLLSLFFCSPRCIRKSYAELSPT